MLYITLSPSTLSFSLVFLKIRINCVENTKSIVTYRRNGPSGSKSGPAEKCFRKLDFCVLSVTVNTQEFIEVVLHHLLAPGE